jgi:hypothetical protein
MLLGPGLVLVGLASMNYLPTHPGWEAAPSISEYYYFNDLTRNGFVGALFAIGMLISAYRGWHKNDMWDRVIAVVSWLAAWLVALVPCYSCYSKVHFGAAAVLFGMMAAMLWFRFTDATGDEDELKYPRWKGFRNRIYRGCALLIAGAMIVRAFSLFNVLGLATVTPWNLTFWIEVVGLSAFSLGWLTKSRFLFGYEARDGLLHRTPALESALT